MFKVKAFLPYAHKPKWYASLFLKSYVLMSETLMHRLQIVNEI